MFQRSLCLKVADAKTEDGREAWNPDGLVPQVIRAVKPRILSSPSSRTWRWTPTRAWGRTASWWATASTTTRRWMSGRQAACHAAAGADVVAPSDMMDGRVGRICATLDAAVIKHPYPRTPRVRVELLRTLPRCARLGSRGGTDKRTYQMTLPMDASPDEVAIWMRAQHGDGQAGHAIPRHRLAREGLRLSGLRVPSVGEYAMFKAAAERGWIDELRWSWRRCWACAGADAILTYYATDVARWLSEVIAARTHHAVGLMATFGEV